MKSCNQLLTNVGSATNSFLEEISSLVRMGSETCGEFFEQIAAGRSPIAFRDLFYQTNRVGAGSIPLVTLVSLFIGLTMALLTGYQLRIFGLVALVPAVVSVSFIREMGPLFTGIILASRIGAAYTAELGAMTASEEVDAIEGMGIGALRYLVLPRFLAILALTPSLSIIATLSAIIGGAIISKLLLGLSYAFFYDQVMTNLFLKDVVSGVIKSFLFGGIIGWLACYKGLAVRGGAVGVGQATTASVVLSITSVIACDTACNVVMVIFFP